MRNGQDQSRQAFHLRVGVLALVVCAAGVRAELRGDLDRALGDITARCAVSARVLALPSGEVLYSANADAPMKPASNMKLLTSATALATLGSAFRFHTALARHGDDLVVIGGGDPATGDPALAEMTGRDRLALFERWATILAERGIRRVRGDLILDDTIFDDVHVHPSWPSDQLQKWYAAPVAGINLNDNCIDVTVWPADAPGQPGNFAVMPPNDWTKIINQTVTRRQGIPTIGWGSSPGTFVLSGPCSSRGTLQSVAVTDPVAVFGSALRVHLAARGIIIEGQTRRGRARSPHGRLAPGVVVLDDAVTPLADVILRCNRDSQNFFAEAIFKQIGYARMFRAGDLKPQGSWESGRAAVAAYLDSLNLKTGRLVIDDGSGLSHDNRVTAVVLTEVLRRAFTGPDRDLFISTLATPGGDGTFRRRLTDVSDGLYVKTGTIDGVRALSGYVRTGDDQWLCFSLLCNDIRGKTQPVKDAQDRFCRVLVGLTAVPASASP